MTGPLFLCKIYKYHIKNMEPEREKLKLIVRNLELLVEALKAEVYSDIDAYQPGEYLIGDDDDGYAD